MGQDVSMTGILGIVSLMGILVRNGIIMLDYAEELRHKHNLPVYDAALEAGKRRMRPIFLTSAAASMGVIPMIISNSPLWGPMGTVICFGTLISMVLVVTGITCCILDYFQRQPQRNRFARVMLKIYSSMDFIY